MSNSSEILTSSDDKESLTTDIVAHLRKGEVSIKMPDGSVQLVNHVAADEIERLREALLEIFDHECRTSDRSFIACTARDALWPRTALAGEKK